MPFVFLAPKGPDQAVPEAEREWGLKSQGCCRRGASMTKALGMQVCRSVLTGLGHTSASRDVVDLFPH